MRKFIMIAALLACSLPIAAPAQSSSNRVRLNGVVVSTAPASVLIRTSTGQQRIALGSQTRFYGLSNSSLDKVTENSFIGTTVIPQPNGTYVSTEVHVFAPSLRGTGEGFTKMDSAGKHMMANSTVTSVARATHMMANSTVKSVGSNGGQKAITMVFPSGTIHVTIPANTPVTYIEPGSRAMLTPGAQVIVLAARESSGLRAQRLIVGQGGAKPF